MVPFFTKQIVSSTFRFQNVIYLVKSGRSGFSSWIIKMSADNLRKCLLECRDEILFFYQNLRSIWLLFSIMFSLLVILFIIKLYARINTFKYFDNLLICGYFVSSVKIMKMYSKKDLFSFNHMLCSYNLPFLYGTLILAHFSHVNTQMPRRN